jgi:hypothetical protein
VVPNVRHLCESTNHYKQPQRPRIYRTNFFCHRCGTQPRRNPSNFKLTSIAPLKRRRESRSYLSSAPGRGCYFYSNSPDNKTYHCSLSRESTVSTPINSSRRISHKNINLINSNITKNHILSLVSSTSSPSTPSTPSAHITSLLSPDRNGQRSHVDCNACSCGLERQGQVFTTRYPRASTIQKGTKTKCSRCRDRCRA